MQFLTQNLRQWHNIRNLNYYIIFNYFTFQKYLIIINSQKLQKSLERSIFINTIFFFFFFTFTLFFLSVLINPTTTIEPPASLPHQLDQYQCNRCNHALLQFLYQLLPHHQCSKLANATHVISLWSMLHLYCISSFC